MKSKGFAVGIWVYGSCPDRFCTRGYKKGYGLEETLDQIAASGNLSGVMMHYPDPLNEKTAEKMKSSLEQRGLQLASCEVDLFSDPVFALGSMISEREGVRGRAIETAKRAMDMAECMGECVMSLWPGQDGFDYPFEIDYVAQWSLLVDAIYQIASSNPRVKLSMEYKLREPRTHSSISTAGEALFLAYSSGLPNVGVTVDFGHSLNCKESPGNVVALLDKYGRLFGLHLNDNFRDWDDDMAVGTVHFFETLEFLYYLNRSRYEGWLGLDIFPYREDPSRVCKLSIDNIRYMMQVVEKIDIAELKAIQKEANAMEAMEYIKKKM
ncbi:MAG: TIM barrel protein [Candidatus Atribacteria bacterium]|nr:TIM barrel protein [Candidatus Atribacteria bacterium]